MGRKYISITRIESHPHPPLRKMAYDVWSVDAWPKKERVSSIKSYDSDENNRSISCACLLGVLDGWCSVTESNFNAEVGRSVCTETATIKEVRYRPCNWNWPHLGLDIVQPQAVLRLWPAWGMKHYVDRTSSGQSLGYHKTTHPGISRVNGTW